jgi:hypothetical protein
LRGGVHPDRFSQRAVDALAPAAGVAGANRLRVRGGKLRRGRYALRLVATDAAGNRSAVLRARVRVR